jgi:hypothetical protein
MTTIGPHLLGRKPSPPDERDWKLSLFLETDPVQAAITELQLTTVGFKNRYWTVPPKGTHWAQGLALLGWTPPGPVVTTAKEWENPEAPLDQGDTGHCVGFSGAGWGNTLPVDDKFTNQDGHDFYYLCKIVDGEPKAEDGSYVRSIAKVLSDKKRLDAYAWASSTDEITTWLLTKGPVMIGSDWYNDMFNPDSNGLMSISGGVAGGHAYVLCGVDLTTNQYKMLNSWGSNWGKNGYAYINIPDFGSKLLSNDGEACAALELTIPTNV